VEVEVLVEEGVVEVEEEEVKEWVGMGVGVEVVGAAEGHTAATALVGERERTNIVRYSDTVRYLDRCSDTVRYSDIRSDT
jgi:hypothetical protein